MPKLPAPVSNLNIANLLTVIRLVLVPTFVWLMLLDGVSARWAALAVFCLASLTDKLDGTLARRYNLITNFGKLADPIADKLLVLSALVMLSLELPWLWLLTVPVAIREVGITVMRLLLANEVVLAASMGGKVKTSAQILLIVLLLVPWSFVAPGWWTPIVVVVVILSVIVGVITLLTGVQYLREAKRIHRGA